jgi:hypothetical protein
MKDTYIFSKKKKRWLFRSITIFKAQAL